MKKNILLLLTTIIISCGAINQTADDDHIIVINKSAKIKKLDRDSLNIVTPAIEIYHRENNVSHSKYDDRETIKKFVIDILKSELNKSDYFDLPLMSEDYLMVNRVMENITYQKYTNPELMVDAPEEILISEEKYTILVSITAYYGDLNNGVMYLSVINNHNKLIESVDLYGFSEYPLNKKQIEKGIKKILAKITNK